MGDSAVNMKLHGINYRFHLPIIALLTILNLSLPMIQMQYYKVLVLGRLQKSSTVDGVFRFGQYAPLSDRGIPAQYLLVEVAKEGQKTTENYYERDGRVTIVLYQNGHWLHTRYRSYAEDFRVVGPVLGFILSGLASLARTARVVFSGGADHYIWNENDFWKFPYLRIERLALLYGVPLFISAFFIAFF